MKHITTLAAGMLFLGVVAGAGQETPLSRNDNKSLLWKISGKDMKKPSFLFGTIHMLCAEDYVWTAPMRSSLKKCREVCFEMDMDDPSIMTQIAIGMADNSGQTLKDYFSNEDYVLVERFVKDSLGMSLAMFRQMKPAALQSIFATRALSCAAPVSYEMNIMEEAKKNKMEITGLEEANEQLELFDSLPVDSVVKDLVAMAKDYKRERMEYQKMLAAYKQQDIPLLYELITTGQSSGEDLKTFLDDRNHNWISRMEGRMDQQPVFFAVGAGHLWGEDGIIQLLRNTGYEVTPVK